MKFFLVAFVISLIFTLVIKYLAQKLDITDKPDEKRKKHNKNIPLLGGTAIYISFWIVVWGLYFLTDFLKSDINLRQLLFLFLGTSFVIIIGFFDDKYKLSAKKRLFLSLLAVFVVMLGGMQFDGITNPWGGTVGLDFWQISFGSLGVVLVIADFLIFLWILGMIYTTKVLDGLDGLASGVVFFGAVLVASIASSLKFYQPDIAVLSLVFAGSILGFLLFNFYPAKIFLGEGGSMFLGMVLAVLAVVSGGKIATALLVMAIPILDLLRVIILRLKNKKKLFEGDRKHLHFQLLDIGWHHRNTVLVLYLISFSFGLSTLFLHSLNKLIALGVLFIIMLLFATYVFSKQKV